MPSNDILPTRGEWEALLLHTPACVQDLVKRLAFVHGHLTAREAGCCPHCGTTAKDPNRASGENVLDE